MSISDDEICQNVGDEFNPLEDPDNPTDSSAETIRGAIDDVTVILGDDDMQSFTQSAFLQNLGGSNSIIGRSVTIVFDTGRGLAT